MNVNSDIFIAYKRLVKASLDRASGQWWLDAGGGRVCEFFDLLEEAERRFGITVDVSRVDLCANRQLIHFVEADLDCPLPFRDDSLAAIYSSRTVEHLKSPHQFLSECFRILRPGGDLILALPTGRAPFSLIKRILPNSLTKALVSIAHSGPTEGLCWAPLYYRNCSPGALVEMLAWAGFAMNHVHISFRQAHLFKSFALAYWPMCVYDVSLAKLRLSPLAAYVAVSATKP